ncbi:N-acetyltransferase [Rhizocola hellebori]|uniref:N-acetyltransferase n=1 Tax=Rhizocola hellebori TaxID=1392758 RepID=A0A8J3QGM8_9ACTN|nr:GNAT family N-acetyltransferase [Rhizocola hellebori]GIH09304.1 N-acetyltransferase [Rhizocola hellebori]
MSIREATLDDLPAFDLIRQASYSWHYATLAAQRNWATAIPPEARILQLAAEVDGVVVGLGLAALNVTTSEPGVGFATCTVHPRFRRRGIGSALYERLDAHLGTLELRRAQGYALDRPDIVAWAQARGWTSGASARYSAVGLDGLPPIPPTPAGANLVSLSALTPEAVYELDTRAAADEPGDVSHNGMPYDLWLSRLWNSPDLNHEMSQVAVVDGVPVAHTLIEANLHTGRCWSGGTATLPAYRGRGLAKVLKSVALRKAAAAGITTAVTANDYTNAAMLAVNDWLGYKVIDSQRSMLKTFQGADDLADDDDGGRA